MTETPDSTTQGLADSDLGYVIRVLGGDAEAFEGIVRRCSNSQDGKGDLNIDRELELDTMEHTLASEEALVPSSGFLNAVMERVREESNALPPIPFPWRRAIPGFALAAGVFGWGAVEMIRYAASQTVSLAPMHLSVVAISCLETTG